MKKFVLLGGQVKQRFVQSFNDLQNKNFDLIINCSGLGASILANDSSVLPIRGQVMRVKIKLNKINQLSNFEKIWEIFHKQFSGSSSLDL